MAEIAGHTFVNGWCSCGLSWISIRYADDNALHDTPNAYFDPPIRRWAHNGQLNARELEEIRAESVKEDERIVAAMEECLT